ncbi:spatacsin-like [Watersipora subatra]|uniref:spatacsin-like n=1 Tax=Watersipora subatra TaxID=2589382 RepID=UPI00355AEE8B
MQYSQRDVANGLIEAIIARNGWSGEVTVRDVQQLVAAIEKRDSGAVLNHIRLYKSFVEDLMSTPSLDYRHDVEEMCSLLYTASATYVEHTSTRAFALQVSEAMLSFLKEQSRKGMAMLNEMLLTEKTEKRALMEGLVEKMSDHTMPFSDLLAAHSKPEASKAKSKGGKQKASAKHSSTLSPDLIAKWNLLSSKELIGDGILMGDISLLQSYFRRGHRQTESSFDYIVATGLTCVLEELEARNWTTACQMLKNMGFGMFSKLSQIALYTTDSALRDYLVQQLLLEGTFTAEEKKAIEFSAEINGLYPCQSFQHATALQQKANFNRLPNADIFAVAKFCGEVGVVSQDITESCWYSHYMQDWLQHWMPYKEDILIERCFNDPLHLEKLETVSAAAVWSYLCRHNICTIIIDWIDVMYAGKSAQQPFQKQPITMEMIDECGATLPVVNKSLVMDHLTKLGVLSSSISLSVQRKFSTLARSGLLLVREQVGSILSTSEMVCHCVDHGLLELLFQCFHSWKISEGDVRDLESCIPGKTYLLVDMLYSFYKLTVHGPDSGNILEASLTSSRYLAKKPYLSHAEMLSKQLSNISMCNLLYHSPILEGSKHCLNPEQLEAYKGHRLLKYLFGRIEDSSSPEIPDISIYDLIEKWGTLYGGRLFAVQHRKETSNPVEASSEMFHFSNKDLSHRYAVNVKLTFLHYLKQSRPCFAFLAFLTNETSMNNGAAIPTSRMKLAIKQTHYLAVRWYNIPEVVSSCSAFLELMGENTERLRLLISAAHILDKGKALRYSNLSSKAIHEQVESLLLPAVFSLKCSFKDAYNELVECADRLISGSSIEAGIKWKTVIDLSRMYSQALPTRFLEHCAHTNDWLSFLIYCQIFSYDLSTLGHIVSGFKLDGVREQIQCVLDTSRQRETSAAAAEDMQRENREQCHDKMTNFASRKHKEVTVLVSSSDDERKNIKNIKGKSINKPPDVAPVPASNGNGIPPERLPNDIFGVLFLTNNHPGSWKQLNSYAIQLENPMLALMAASNKNSVSLECLTCWLAASLPSIYTSQIKNLQPSRGVPRKTTLSAVNCCLDNSRLDLLKTGLKIFAPLCPLLPLLDAITELPGQKFFVVSSLLGKFKSQMKKLLQAKFVRADEFTFQELVSLSLRMIQVCIESFDVVLCERFLHLLDETNLLPIYSEQNVNFAYVYRVYKVVLDLQLEGVNCVRLISSQCLDEVRNVLRVLIERKEFAIARTLSSLCDLDPTIVSFQELISDADQARRGSNWKMDVSNKVLWKECDTKCIKYDLMPEQSSAFFEEQAFLPSTSLQDKVDLSEHAYRWRKQSPDAYESEHLSRLQKMVWQSKIDLLLHSHVKDNQQLLTGSSPKRPPSTISIDKTQFLQIEQRLEKLLYLLKHSNQTPTPNNTAVSELIGQMLDEFKIEEACLVSIEYGCTTKDVVLIQVCLGLAMKRLDPLALENEVMVLLDASAGRRRASSTSQSYLLATSSAADSYPKRNSHDYAEKKDERLSMLERVAEKCTRGSKACDKIVCCYSISVALELSYRDTVLQSEYSLLKLLLNSQVSSKYELAIEYIDTCALSDSDIACFLSGQVYNSLLTITGLQNQNLVHLELSPDELMVAVSECDSAGRESRQLIQLFTDQTAFGLSLLEQANGVSVEEPNIKLKLAIKVELLILSHEAYSCAYDMEGISSVLRSCRTCTIQINTLSYYALMVHLLTGVGRYSEMSYIFDTLKQNHQFELLFRKGRSKDNKLKLAVLDYLRRFCPGDNEIYRVVSSHFAMYREIADLLEEAGLRKLAGVTSISPKAHDQLSSTLSDILKNLTDAAEIYVEGKCLEHAQSCVRQARLVYLQISLLSSGQQVVNLEPQQVKSFIEQHDKFSHAFTVSEAYRKNCWAAALSNNVIVKGDFKYMTEFKKTFTLTPALIIETVQRFQIKTDIPQTSQIDNNLRRLLGHCKDVLVKYKLAQSLGLSDVLKEMLAVENGVPGAVIRDANLGGALKTKER